MSMSFTLTWRGVAVHGPYDARPGYNRRDRVFLDADAPLFADGGTYLVKWFGPLDRPLAPELFAELAEDWLDEAAENRGLHPDDMKRRQLQLL